MEESLIEVCAAHLQSALAAQDGGAKRVELCDNLYEGGTTPSYGAIKIAREKLKISLNVLIRPRGSDFYYFDLEFELMKEDIGVCKKLGVDGVVFGILLPDGNIGMVRMKELVGMARPMSITFHRAFDMTPEPFRALDEITILGIDRILTSGQKNTAPEGIGLIKQLVKKAANRIIIMPGSGINEQNICEIRDETQAREFHLTGRNFFDSQMAFRRQGIYMGGLSQIPEYQISLASAPRIRKLVSLISRL